MLGLWLAMSNIGEAFDAIRIEVMTQQRDTEKLKAEVLSMREKMRAAQQYTLGFFDIKHSLGRHY